MLAQQRQHRTVLAAPGATAGVARQTTCSEGKPPFLLAVTVQDSEWDAAVAAVKPSGLMSLVAIDSLGQRRSCWADVGGLTEVKRRLEVLIIWPLRAPAICAKLKQSGPRGVLLYGPPGTGKTLIVRALASEVPLVSAAVTPACAYHPSFRVASLCAFTASGPTQPSRGANPTTHPPGGWHVRACT
jgi:hypothetical protein